MEVETNNNNNVIFEPQYIKLDKDEFNKNSNNINNHNKNEQKNFIENIPNFFDTIY